MKLSVWVEGPSKAGTYSVRYYDPATGDKAPRSYCLNKRDMLAEKSRIQAMLLAWKGGKRDVAHIPLVIFDQYLTELKLKGHRPATIQMKKNSLIPFLNTAFDMAHITTDRIKTYLTELTTKYKSMDTVSIKLRDLRAFLRWAHKQGIIGANPFQGIPIPTSTFLGRRIAKEEVTALLQTTSGTFRSFLILALDTGARHGELLGATWEEIDLARGTWYIPAAKCKTKHARYIPLGPVACSVLNSLAGQGGPGPFHTLNKCRTRLAWAKALRDAGIKGRVRIHDLRHTWASNYGGRSNSLMATAGWRSPSMALRYSHTEIEELREDMAKNKLGEILGQFGGDSDTSPQIKGSENV